MKSEILKAAAIAHDVFKREGWTWGRYEGSYVPTYMEIADRYEYLVGRLKESDADRISTGRLMVERCPFVDQAIRLHVEVGGIEDDEA